jgi:hypothetical protein
MPPTDTITLKHLCREFDLDSYPLRQKLRQHLKHAKGQRWKWKPDDPELAKARQVAKAMKESHVKAK